jgi:hypothetical protein
MLRRNRPSPGAVFLVPCPPIASNQTPAMNESIHAAVLEIAREAILGALENGDAEATINQLSNGIHAAWCQAMVETGANVHLPFSKIAL